MNQLYEGKICAKAILENPKRKIYTLYIDKNKRNKDISYLLYLAKSRNIAIEFLSSLEIQSRAKSHTHGGVLLEAKTLVPLQEITQKLSGFLCYIDGVEDPYNLGSVIRTLYAAGCQGLFLPKRDWSFSESTVLKASAGAYDKLDIYQLEESHFFQTLKDANIPLLLAHRKDAVSLYDYEFEDTFCLAIGGALRGLNARFVQNANQHIFLEYGRDCKYALDTASAVSAFSFEILRQRRKNR